MVAEKPPLSSRALVRPHIVATTTAHAGPLSIVAARASSKASGALSLSLSWWRNVSLPLALWQEFGPNFR